MSRVKIESKLITVITGTESEVKDYILSLITPQGELGYKELDNCSVQFQLSSLPAARRVGPPNKIVKSGDVYLLKNSLVERGSTSALAVSLESVRVQLTSS